MQLYVCEHDAVQPVQCVCFIWLQHVQCESLWLQPGECEFPLPAARVVWFFSDCSHVLIGLFQCCSLCRCIPINSRFWSMLQVALTDQLLSSHPLPQWSVAGLWWTNRATCPPKLTFGTIGCIWTPLCMCVGVLRSRYGVGHVLLWLLLHRSEQMNVLLRWSEQINMVWDTPCFKCCCVDQSK